MFQSKEFKIITTFIFLLFAIAIIMKLYFYNRISYADHIAQKVKAGETVICINEDTNEAYKTNENSFELLKVKTPCFNDISKFTIVFKEKNKAFDILDCNVFKTEKIK